MKGQSFLFLRTYVYNKHFLYSYSYTYCTLKMYSWKLMVMTSPYLQENHKTAKEK